MTETLKPAQNAQLKLGKLSPTHDNKYFQLHVINNSLLFIILTQFSPTIFFRRSSQCKGCSLAYGVVHWWQEFYVSKFPFSALRLSPRYPPIWTIYIPFERPWLLDFRNARSDLNFWCYVMPCGATLCRLVFSGGIAAWEQRHTSKTIRLKILPNLLFYQFISKLFASRSALCHLSPTQRSWKNLDYIKFRSTFTVSIEVSKFSEAKINLGTCYCS